MKAFIFMMSKPCHNGFWFRIYGYGIGIINRDIYQAPFSVRYGFRKEWRIGKYGVQLLNRSQMKEFSK